MERDRMWCDLIDKSHILLLQLYLERQKLQMAKYSADRGNIIFTSINGIRLLLPTFHKDLIYLRLANVAGRKYSGQSRTEI